MTPDKFFTIARGTTTVAERAFLAPARGAHYAVAVLLAAAYWAFMLWGPGPYLVTTTMVDLEIPAKAAIAWRDGWNLYADLHSPFGYFYFLHYGLALAICEFFKADYHLHDLLITANVLMLAFLLALMRLLERFMRVVYPQWFLALAALAVCANVFPSVFFRSDTWSVAYNNYMCTLYLIAAIGSWQAFYYHKDDRLRAETIAFALLVFFTAFYKFSFAVVLTGLWMTRMAASARAPLGAYAARAARLAGLFAAVAGGAALLLPLLGGFELSAYWEDLQAAARGRSDRSVVVVKLQGLPLMAAFFAACYWLMLRLKYCRHWLALFLWCGGFLLALYLCGIGANPFGYFMYMLLAVVAHGGWLHWRALPAFFRTAAAVAAAVALVVMFALPLARQVALKAAPPASGFNHHVAARLNYATPSYVAARLDYATPSFYYAPPRRFSLDAAEGYEENPHWEGIYLATAVNETRAIYEKWRRIANIRSVGFMGGWDVATFFLGDIPATKRQLHWKHVYTTFTPQDAPRLLGDDADASDMILMFTHVMHVLSDMHAACWFLRSPAAQEFRYVQKGDVWHVFVRASQLPPDTKEIMPLHEMLAQPALAKQCDAILAEKHPAGYYLPWYAATERLYDLFAAPAS